MNRPTSREAKIFRLGQHITEHPTYSYNRLNKLLVQEFGSGLRKQFTLELVRGIRPVAARPTLAPEASYNGRYETLKRNGFLPTEAKQLARMEGIKPENRASTFISKTWQAAIAAHQNYTRTLIDDRIKAIAGRAQTLGIKLTQQQIIDRAKREVSNLLRQAMKADQYSPYDWLKVEYKPKKTPTGYQMEARAKAVDRLNEFIDKARKTPTPVFWD